MEEEEEVGAGWGGVKPEDVTVFFGVGRGGGWGEFLFLFFRWGG